MESPSPDGAGLQGQESGNSPEHLPGSLICKGQQQDRLGFDTVIQQPGNTVGERPCFAATRPGQNQGRPGTGSHRFVLLIVQFGPIVGRTCNHRGSFLELIFAGHDEDRFAFWVLCLIRKRIPKTQNPESLTLTAQVGFPHQAVRPQLGRLILENDSSGFQDVAIV